MEENSDWNVLVLCKRRKSMEANLTLKINGSVLNDALHYANQKGVDLSVIIEDFLKKIVSTKKKEIAISDEVKELAGLLSDSQINPDWKEDKAEYLMNKYK